MIFNPSKYILLVLICSLLNAGIKEDFFSVGLSSKALALGGTAFGFGTDSLYSNPAGLAVIPEEYYTYSYKSSFDKMIDTMTFQYMRPYKRGAWGVGLIHMNNGNADKTEIDEFDRPLVVGKFGEVQTGISAAYAVPIWGDSAWGLGVRYYHNEMDGEYANALGFFAGFIKKLRHDWLWGISINNFSLSNKLFSTPINWSTRQVDYFPLRISNSLAHRRYLWNYQTEFFADWHLVQVDENNKMTSFYSLGAMTWVIPKVFNGRIGFNDETISLGGGLRLGKWGVDYAYLSHQYLGGSHYITFSYNPYSKVPEPEEQTKIIEEPEAVEVDETPFVLPQVITASVEVTVSENIEPVIVSENVISENIPEVVE